MMALVDYRCTACRSLQFRACGLSYERLEVQCGTCRTVMAPAAVGPVAAEHACPSCGRSETRIMAPSAVGYCARCGVETIPAVSPAPAPLLGEQIERGSSSRVPRATVQAPTV